MSSTIRDHTLHTYKRSDIRKNIYKCLHPHCRHYADRDFLENKAVACPKCGEEFILTLEHLKKRIPVCLKCSKSPKKYNILVADELIEDALNKIVKVEVEVNENED